MLSVVDRGPPPTCPNPFNLAEEVLSAGAVTPDRIALQILRASGAERWSYARLIAAVRGTGGGLLAMGLQPGDRVLMRLGNGVAFPILFLGAIAAGLVPVPTSAQLTAAEITSMATKVNPQLIVVEPGIALPDHPAPVLDVDALRKMQDGPPCDWDHGDSERLAYVIFTSGSSGSARPVAHAHRAVRARRMMWDGWYGLRPDDRLLHAGAFNWTYTLGTGLLDPWAIGATALVPAAGVDHAAIPLLMKRFDATIIAGAPGVFRQILRGPGPFALPQLRHGLSAGEKLPDTTRKAWEDATGTPIHEALGMSEISTFVSSSPTCPAPPGTTGYAQPGRRIAVLGPEGEPVPRGTPGVLAVDRSDPGLFLGYLDDAQETAARFSGRWFLTGDTVRMDDDGAITYLGREDDMMNAGGFRVSPAEVEQALAQHPGVAEVAVAEVRVNDAATVIGAFYTGPVALPEGELAAFAAERLARYKQPRIYRHVAELPRGPNNKILRRVLRMAEARNPS